MLLDVTVVELKPQFAERLKQIGYRFLQIDRNSAKEEVILANFHVGSWERSLRKVQTSPVQFKYYLPSGTPFTGEGTPLLRVANDSEGAHKDGENVLVRGLQFQAGPDEPVRGLGRPMPHFAISMEAIADYYLKDKKFH